MPRAHPPEFRQRAVELVRLREKPTSQIAADLGISDSCPRSWVRQADIEDGHRPGVTQGRACRTGRAPPRVTRREDGSRDPEARGGVLRETSSRDEDSSSTR